MNPLQQLARFLRWTVWAWGAEQIAKRYDMRQLADDEAYDHWFNGMLWEDD